MTTQEFENSRAECTSEKQAAYEAKRRAHDAAYNAARKAIAKEVGSETREVAY